MICICQKRPELSKDRSLRIMQKPRNHDGWKPSLLMFIFCQVRSICVTFFNGENQMTFSCWCDTCPATSHLCCGISRVQRERGFKKTVLRDWNRTRCCWKSSARCFVWQGTDCRDPGQQGVFALFALLSWRPNPEPCRYQARPQSPATPQASQQHFMKRQVPWRCHR